MLLIRVLSNSSQGVHSIKAENVQDLQTSQQVNKQLCEIELEAPILSLKYQ